MARGAFTFNFGPISRTLGDPPDYIGFASLPIHETVTALLGARSREEFIAWLWHDTFKALFTWESSGQRYQWRHLPRDPIQRIARDIGVSEDLVLEHHARNSPLLSESQIVTNEFDARYLGAEARFIQLTFMVHPAATTLVLRLIVMEAFLRAVGEVIGEEVRNLGLPFTRVVYAFEGETSQNVDEIMNRYRAEIGNETLTIHHVVPSGNFARVQLTVDLTGAPPNLHEPQTLALPELLTVYRGDLTVIVGLPLFVADPDGAVRRVRDRMRDLTTDLLKEMGITTQHKRQVSNANTDLWQIALDEQVEVRLVSRSENVPNNNGKPVHVLIGRPYDLMNNTSLRSRCLVCGSPIQGGQDRYFKRSRNALRDIFSDNFTDLEHIDLSAEDVCPLCLIYANSDNKSLLRGSMAILTPSTSLGAPVSHRLIEQPRFDQAGRFDPNQPMVKAGMTLQEMVLLTILSCRIIAGLMPFDLQMGTGDGIGEVRMHRASRGQQEMRIVGRYLPYSGSYLLFDHRAVRQFFETVFLGKDPSGKVSYDVWQTVRLVAYPFELDLSPSFIMLLELQENADSQTHVQAHTLLKVKPSAVYLSPNSAFYVLVDNSIQERIDRGYVQTWRDLDQLASAAGVNHYEFIQALLSGDDPWTAAYQVAPPSRRMGAVNKICENRDTPEEMWNSFIQQREEIMAACQEHPTLVHFLVKPKRRTR